MPNSVPADPRLPPRHAPALRNFACMSCHYDGLDFGYMVHDLVWTVEAGLAKKAGILCLACLEAKLKRDLKPEDFVLGVPVNTNIFFGIKLAGQPEWWEKHRVAMKAYQAARQVKQAAKRTQFPSRRDPT